MNEIFSQFQQRYQQLRALQEVGRLTQQQFLAELQNLRWQDDDRFWWTIDTRGVFLRFDGRQWVPAQPAPMPANPLPSVSFQPVQASPGVQAAKTGHFLSRVAPILAGILSLGCGGSWFLYTLIGAYRSGNIWGVDWITPLIIGGLPLIFWVFRKPIDKILLPFKPILQKIPKPLRVGMALVVPLLLSCGCSTLATGGYLALSVSTFVSVMIAVVLLRY